MLKYFSMNVSLIDALELMLGYAKFLNDMVKNKRPVNFKDDDQMQNCSVISTRSLVQ